MRTSACKQLLARIRMAVQSSQPDCFARKRGIVPPAVAMLCLLALVALTAKTGYEPMLLSLFSTLGDALGWRDPPAASSFCRARKKLTTAMFDLLRAEIHRAAGPSLRLFMPRRRSYRVVAIDGSWITVPNSKLLRKALGVHVIGPKKTAMKHPQVLLVILTDALTRMPIARVVLPGNGSERAAAKLLLHHLRQDDILLADRGFHGRELLAAIRATGCRFVQRMTSGAGAWREVRALQRRRIRDARCTIALDKTMVSLRHIRVSGGPGRPRKNSRRDTQFLLTNLTSDWSVKSIGELYRCRWGVETLFRELKCTLEGNGIHARTLSGVIQELDARCIHLMIAGYLEIAAVLDAVGAEDHGRWRSRHTVNRTALLLLVSIILLASEDAGLDRRCATAARTIARRSQRKRPGRFAPRNGKMFKKGGVFSRN